MYKQTLRAGVNCHHFEALFENAASVDLFNFAPRKMVVTYWIGDGKQ